MQPVDRQTDARVNWDEPARPLGWRDRMDPRRKIAIVGTAPDTHKLAPWDDPTWQIWICNDMALGGMAPRWDASFEIHGEEHVRQNLPGEWAWLQKSHGKPVVLSKAIAGVPDGLVYPLEEVTAAFGRYITSSVAAMLGMAILLKPEEIGLFGVNMAQEDGQETEYSRQRPSCEYFAGICVGAGIRLTVPKASDLLKCASIYGFESSPLAAKLTARKAELQTRLAQAVAQENHWTTQRISLQAMLGELGYWENFSGKQG